MKVVFDTSVLFAAVISTEGFCALIVRLCFDRAIEVVTSKFILDELERGLRTKTKVSDEAIVYVLDTLRSGCVEVMPASVPADSCRDPNDLPILGTAVAAQAALLITVDKDLLTLGQFRSTRIVSPREFHQEFLGSDAGNS